MLAGPTRKDILKDWCASVGLGTCALGAPTNLGSIAFDGSRNYYLRAQLALSSGYNSTIKGIIGLVSLAANGSLGLWLAVNTDSVVPGSW
jgi:hypothetical protein